MGLKPCDRQECGARSVGGGRGRSDARPLNAKGAEHGHPAALRPFDRALGQRPKFIRALVQRPKFIAPTSPNDVSPPVSPTGMLMLGFRLNRELNTNPVPNVSSP